MRRTRQRAGTRGAAASTLIELLAALAIISLLAAMLLGTLGRARARARTAACIANVRQLVMAAMLYAADHDGHFPLGAPDLCFDPDSPFQTPENRRRWCGVRSALDQPYDFALSPLHPYMPTARIPPCPEVAAGRIALRPGFETGSGGYGYNQSYVGGSPGLDCRHSARVDQVAAAADTVLFADSAFLAGTDLVEYPFCEPPYWDLGDRLAGHSDPTTHFRHGGRAVVGWCDGHLSAETPGRHDWLPARFIRHNLGYVGDAALSDNGLYDRKPDSAPAGAGSD